MKVFTKRLNEKAKQKLILVVVLLSIVLGDLVFELIRPSHVILNIASHDERWISNHLRADSNVTVLHVLHGGRQRSEEHFGVHHEHGQSSFGQCAGVYSGNGFQSLRFDQTDRVQLVGQLIGSLNTKFVLIQTFDLFDQLLDLVDQFVVSGETVEKREELERLENREIRSIFQRQL